MWKFLEQASFHMDERQYQAQLDAVAEYLTMWRAGETARAGIRTAAAKGPGYTGGGGARAVSRNSLGLHVVLHAGDPVSDAVLQLPPSKGRQTVRYCLPGQVSIPLDVDVEGGRSGEWDSF